MKSIALSRSINLIPFMSLFLFLVASHAMDDCEKEANPPSKTRHYFHSQKAQEKGKTIGTTTNAGSGDETSIRISLTNSTDSAEDSVSTDSVAEEVIYTDAVKIPRSNSLRNVIKKGQQAIKEKIVPDGDNVKANVRKKISRTLYCPPKSRTLSSNF